MAITSGSGREQNPNTLAEQFANPEATTPGKSLHFYGNLPEFNPAFPTEDAPPYTANVIQETIQQIPKPQPTFREKLWQYRGGAAIIAAPGDVLPKIYGTTIVQGRVIWASDIYLDDNGRPRIDIAYGLCEGPIGAYLRIYAGNDKQLLWGANSLAGVASGNRFWKRKKLHFGTLDQTKNNIIENAEGNADTPNYHQLVYTVFKSLKLWKFNNTAPDMWFVVGDQVDEIESEIPDVYEDVEYSNTASLFANNIAGLSNILYFSFTSITNNTVRTLNLGDGAVSSLPAISAVVKQSTDAVTIFKGKVYDGRETGLFRYDDPSWTQVVSVNGANERLRQLIVSPDGEWMLYTINYTFGGNTSLWKFDGTTHSLIGTVLDWLGSNTTGLRWKQFASDSNTIYLMSGNTLIKGTLSGGWIARYSAGGTPYDNASSVYHNDLLYYCVKRSGPNRLDLVEYDDSAGPSHNDYTISTTGAGFPGSYDLEEFSDRIHAVYFQSGSGTDHYTRRLELPAGTFTTLTSSAGTGARYLKLHSHEGALYVGTNNGIWRQGE